MEESLQWLVPDRILYARRSGKETLTALEAFAAQLNRVIEEADTATIDVIWHMVDLDVDGVPQREAMTHLNQIMKHPDVRWFVVVDSHMRGIRRFVAGLIFQLMGIRWRVVDSKDDALKFLQRVDSS